MDIQCTVLCIALFVGTLLNPGCSKSHTLPIPTYFRRTDSDGLTIGRADPEYEDVFKTKFLENRSHLDMTTSELYVNPHAEVDNGARVTVSWKNVVMPSAKDWIGFYCPHNDSASNPLDYFFVTDGSSSSSLSSWKSGFGSKTVSVFNMRNDCEFRYYRYVYGGIYTALVARSNLLQFKGRSDQPMHGHISVTGDPSQMRVMWISGTDDKPYVKFGLSKSKLTHQASGVSNSYKASDMCGFPADSLGFRDPGFIHDVLLSHLQPATVYYYSFGSAKGMSAVYNFTTALAAGDTTPHKFIVYGDQGIDRILSPDGQETANNIIKEYREHSIRHVFHNGDISYAVGFAYLWDQWMTAVQPYATLVPYMVGIGNHEQDHLKGGSKDPSGAGDGYHPKWGNFGFDSGGECGVPMFHRFHMPDNGNFLWWYSYDFGMVHYIMMSTEHNFEPGSRQYEWLENDLSKIDRKKTPWVILGGHRAMYASQDLYDDYIVATNMQRLFEDLLHKYKVDLALWAHYHSYERTCKVYRNKCVKDGITHLVVGTAGRFLDLELFMSKNWSLKRLKEFGYGRVTVYNQTALKFEFIRNKDRAIRDSFYLLK
eukprot:gene5468-6151_t